jgi:hypothetical protein
MPCHEQGTSGSTEEPATRVRYFSGQLLSEEDFDAEQRYLIRKRELHNRALHGTGVVRGLEVRAAGTDSVVVSPGLAIDGCGREIVVPVPTAVALAPGTAEIVLRYREDPSRISPGGEASRVVEGSEVTAEPPGPADVERVVLGEAERTPESVIVRARHRRQAPRVDDLFEIINELRQRVRSLEAQVAALRER